MPGPSPLPEPPADYGSLASFPTLAKELIPSPLYRVHKMEDEPEWFGSSGAHRWDPPPAAVDLFGTCYLGTAALTSLMETFGELPIVTQETVDARNIATLEVSSDGRLADLTTNAIIGSWSLDRRISTGDDYAVSRRWAAAFQSAGFGGVLYESRHHIGGDSIALFGDPGYRPHDEVAVALRVLRLKPDPSPCTGPGRNLYRLACERILLVTAKRHPRRAPRPISTEINVMRRHAPLTYPLVVSTGVNSADAQIIKRELAEVIVELEPNDERRRER